MRFDPNLLPKLIGGSDFQLWKMRTTAVLTGAGLYSLIRTAARETATSESDVTFVERNARLYGMLVCAMDDETMNVVRPLAIGDAVGVWDALCQEYERVTEASKLELRASLYDIDGSVKSITGIATEINIIVARLAAVSVTVGEDEKLAVLVKTAGKQFVPAIAAMYASDRKWTFTETVEKMRDIQEATKGADNLSALRAKKSTADVECYYCHEKGHYASTCKKKREMKKAKTATTSIDFDSSPVGW